MATRFGWLTIFERHLAAGGTAGIDQALKFHRGEHIIQLTVAQLRDA